MSKKPKLPKPPSPDELNGDHDRGFEVYKLLWALQGRVGRLEGLMLLIPAMLGVLLAKAFGAF